MIGRGVPATGRRSIFLLIFYKLCLTILGDAVSVKEIPVKNPGKSGRNPPTKRPMSKCQPQIAVREVETRSRNEPPHPQTRGRSLRMTVATRPLTLEEQRRFEGALDLLLAELVRREIARATSVP